MALIVADRVKETTVTTGTGAVTLAGAATGYRTFLAAVGDGNTCYYTIQAVDGGGNPTGDWETGIGTYAAAGNTLTRTTVQSSSNSNNAVNFGAGTKQVWLDVTAAQLATLATLTGAQSLTNKTLDSSNRMSGLPANVVAGTTYTLAAADAGKFTTFTNGSAVTVTIPTNAAVPIAVNEVFQMGQEGAGKVTFSGAGVTINSKGGNKSIGAQYVGVTLVKTATDTWTIYGELIA